MDDLSTHKDARVASLIASRGIRVEQPPPHSPDLNPIESFWALQKQFARKHAPRSADVLRRVARRAGYRVQERHCRAWFAHAGYRFNPTDLWG